MAIRKITVRIIPANILSIGILTKSMLKKLQASSETMPLLDCVEKDVLHLAYTSDNDEDLDNEVTSSPPCSNIISLLTTITTTFWKNKLLIGQRQSKGL